MDNKNLNDIMLSYIDNMEDSEIKKVWKYLLRDNLAFFENVFHDGLIDHILCTMHDRRWGIYFERKTTTFDAMDTVKWYDTYCMSLLHSVAFKWLNEMNRIVLDIMLSEEDKEIELR